MAASMHASMKTFLRAKIQTGDGLILVLSHRKCDILESFVCSLHMFGIQRGTRGDKTPLMMASTALTTRTEACSIEHWTCLPGCFTRPPLTVMLASLPQWSDDLSVLIDVVGAFYVSAYTMVRPVHNSEDRHWCFCTKESNTQTNKVFFINFFYSIDFFIELFKCYLLS